MDLFLTILTIIFKILFLVLAFYYAFKVGRSYKDEDATNKDLTYNGIWLLFFVAVLLAT